MSIRFRFTLALTAVGLVLFTTYAVWGYRSERRDLMTAARAELRVVGQSVETALGNALRDKQRPDIEETLATIDAFSPNLDIHVFDAGGAPITRSPGATTDPMIPELARQAAASRSGALASDPVDETRRLLYSGPLSADDGTVLGAVVIARPTADLDEDLARTRTRLLLAVLTFLAATMITGIILGTLYVSRPIARLLAGVRHVREGDFRTPVQPGRDDEIGKLVEEFNLMIDTLAQMRERIESEVETRSRLELGLQRVDKLVTIGQLSAGLAHEIGSPLQVLSGRASMLGEHADPEVRRQAALLGAECDRIARVVEQLLSSGRRRPAVTGPCDLVAPVVAVIELLAAEAQRRELTLVLEQDDGPHAIIGDPDQIQQVTLNLVRNAMNATPAGGTITVRVERLDETVRLVVRDTGMGIDAATRARLFEPFFTTRAADGGTGLGLPVVRAIAADHKAKIDVQSEPGRGAQFVVSFPLRRDGAHA